MWITSLLFDLNYILITRATLLALAKSIYYACANQGPVSVTFRAGTQSLKLNAKEYCYSSQLHFVLLPDGYIERLPDENTEKKKEPHMT